MFSQYIRFKNLRVDTFCTNLHVDIWAFYLYTSTCRYVSISVSGGSGTRWTRDRDVTRNDTRAAPLPSKRQTGRRAGKGYTMSTNELNSTARDLMSVRAMIRELEAEAEALTDKLKAAMVERSTETLEGDGWRATWKNVQSQRFDSKAFKADHADLYGQYSKATTTTRFLISA